MVIIAGDRVPGTLVHFSGLRFIVNLEGGLEPVCSSSWLPNADGADPDVDSLRGLRLEVPGDNTSPHVQRPLTDRARVE
jgi:hypothetical protein